MRGAPSGKRRLIGGLLGLIALVAIGGAPAAAVAVAADRLEFPGHLQLPGDRPDPITNPYEWQMM